MAVAGTLEIQMLANMARLQTDMTKGVGIVSGATARMESAVASAKSALAGLGISLGVGYFVSLIKGSIDAMDHLNDLSKTTSIAVETLAGLKVAAKQSGGDLDGIAASINKLSVNMGKDAEKFKALGVSAKDPLEAFKQLADVFVSIKDPQQRAAVMAEALGKSWASAAPLLAEGGAKIGEIVEKGSKLSGVTAEMAHQADELNDKWVLLGGTGGMLTRMVGPLLPLLNLLADGMLTATEKSKGLSDSFSPLLEIMRTAVIMASDVSFTFTTMGKDMARAAENVKLIVTGQWDKSRELGRLFSEDAKRARAELDAWQKKIMELGLTGRGPGSAAGAQDPAAAARAAAFLSKGGSGGDKKEKVDPAIEKAFLAEMRMWDEAQEATQKYYAKLGKINEAQAEFVMKMETTSALRTWSDLDTDLGKASHELAAYNKTINEVSDSTRALFRGMEDALVEFAMTGKLDFKKFADSIIADLIRIQIRAEMTKMMGSYNSSGGGWAGITNAFGSIFSSGGGEAPLALATGTDFVPRDGFAFLHKGEAVTPAGASNGDTFNVDMRGASLEAVQELRAFVIQRDASFNDRAIGAVSDARRRGRTV